MRASALILVLGIALGAFGAHALKNLISNPDTYRTGSLYHLIHGVALFGLSLSRIKFTPQIKWAIWLFVFGIILFSGSLYLLAMKELFENPVILKVLGPLTPIGGISFISGWILILLSRFED